MDTDAGLILAGTRIPMIFRQVSEQLIEEDRAYYFVDVQRFIAEHVRHLTGEEVARRKTVLKELFRRCSSYHTRAIWGSVAHPPSSRRRKRTRAEQYQQKHDLLHGRSLPCTSCGAQVDDDERAGMSICPRCGVTNELPATGITMAHRECFTSSSASVYDPLNHLMDTLHSVQGLRTALPPPGLFAALNEAVRRRKIPPERLTPESVRRLMKAEGLSRRYNFAAEYCRHCGGHGVPTLGKELEDEIKHMFLSMMSAYEESLPTRRANLLSYPYKIRKMLEILDRPDLAKHFKLLKTRDKIWENDRVWRRTCERMGWPFIPTTSLE